MSAEFLRFLEDLHATGKAAHDPISVEGLDGDERKQAEAMLLEHFYESPERCMAALGLVGSAKALPFVLRRYHEIKGNPPDREVVVTAHSCWKLSRSHEAAQIILSALSAANRDARYVAVSCIRDIPEIDHIGMWVQVIRHDTDWQIAYVAVEELLRWCGIREYGPNSVEVRQRIAPLKKRLVESSPGEARQSILRDVAKILKENSVAVTIPDVSY